MFRISTLILTAVISFALLGAGNAQAEGSSCKGKSRSACSSASDCSWVDGYTRKDGAKVKSFCRAKPSAKGVLVETSGASSRINSPGATERVAIAWTPRLALSHSLNGRVAGRRVGSRGRRIAERYRRCSNSS